MSIWSRRPSWLQWIDAPTWNVLQMGFGFQLVFFAYITQSFIEEAVLKNRHDQKHDVEKKAGYYSQTIMYGFFVISNLIAPPILRIIGVRYGLLLGSFAYTIFMIGFLFTNRYYLYITSATEGLCAGVLWTAMGHYLALNSTPATIGRNSGFVWIIYMGSLILGGIFLWVAFGWEGKQEIQISVGTTRVLYSCFAAISLVGNCVFALLRDPPIDEDQLMTRNYKTELRETFRMLSQPDILLLAITFSYSGVELAFWSGVYPTALQFTHNMKMNTHHLVAANAISTGIGELTGGFLFGMFGARSNRYGRWPIICLGSGVGLITYALIFINIPPISPMEDVNDDGLLHPPQIWLGILCGGLMGFTDACINTQIYSLVSVAYAERTTQGFAIHKFFHAIFSTAAMLYGGYAIVGVQLGILALFAVLSAVSFVYVERRHLPRLQRTRSSQRSLHSVGT